MHILEIPSFFPPHGGAFCLEQAKALASRGHEVRILSCVQLGASLDRAFYLRAPLGCQWEEMEGIEVFRHFQRDIPKLVRLNTERWIRQVQRMFGIYVRLHGMPDVIHAHCCKAAGIAATRIGKSMGRPVFITEHLSDMFYIRDFGEGWPKHPWMKEMMIKAYEDATCVIPVAQELVANLEPLFGRRYRFQPISNVIDVDFYAYHERVTAEGRPFRFCCLGNAGGGELMRKGYDVLSLAFRDLDGCELHIAGRGTLRQEMKELFPSGTTIYGELDKHQVRRLLYDCDALVLPSRSEVQPLVLLEAMSTGIPVVSTEVTPQSERIPGACLIAKTGDPDSLRDKMRECMGVRPSHRFSDAVRVIAAPDTVGRQLEELFCKYKEVRS